MGFCRVFRGAVTGNMDGKYHVLVRVSFRLRLFACPKKLPSSRLNVATLEMAEEREMLLTTIAIQLHTITITPQVTHTH